MPSKTDNQSQTLTGYLNRLNATVDEVEQEIADRQRFLSALKVAQDAAAKTALSVNGRRSHRTHKTRRNGNATLTQLLRTVLDSTSEPVTVSQILEELARHGITDKEASVRSTLTSLKKRGEVKNPTYGHWISVTQKNRKVAA